MKLYIIRHGETDLNAQGRLQGQIDIPLNENGRNLARITGEALRQVPFDLIITSPLSRARETALLVTSPSAGQHHRHIPLITDSRLMEINWGQWDTLSCLKGNSSIPEDELTCFYTNPLQFKGAPDGESLLQVCRRTGEFYQELLANPDYQEKSILISAHGCSLRGLLYQISKDKSDFWRGGVPLNCSLSIVQVNEGKALLLEQDKIYYDPSLCLNHYHNLH